MFLGILMMITIGPVDRGKGTLCEIIYLTVLNGFSVDYGLLKCLIQGSKHETCTTCWPIGELAT